MGMTVYGTGRKHAGVHRTDDCPLLIGRALYPVRRLDLAQMQAPNLCRACFPKVPRTKSWHSLCRTCAYPYPYPCRHNGGIQVWVPQRDGVSTRATGERGLLMQTRYVWPEHAHHYVIVRDHTLANPGHTQ